MARNILAYFRSTTQAEKAARALRREGYDEVQIARVHRYADDGIDHVFNPTSGRITSLAKLTLGADVDAEEDVGPLLAADPAASGWATGGGLVDGPSVLLTVVPPSDEAADHAEAIIRYHGGQV